MKLRMVRLAAVLGLVVGAGSCATQDRGSHTDAGHAGTPPAAAGGLAGTSWQLVQFQSMDDTTLEPDERSKYTINFGEDGKAIIRLNCNRGFATWNSSGANQLEFGPLALTKAQCPAGSLHDRFVKDLPYVRSYILKEGHLYVSLMADGGIYEFEPAVGP
jgi:para-nitrobenzyl esterase